MPHAFLYQYLAFCARFSHRADFTFYIGQLENAGVKGCFNSFVHSVNNMDYETSESRSRYPLYVEMAWTHNLSNS